MSNVNTGDLLNVHDFSPDRDRSARIDVEAVHTNQYNTMTNNSYHFEEPKMTQEPEAVPQCELELVYLLHM